MIYELLLTHVTLKFILIELSSFDEVRDSLFSDDVFLSLQKLICENPEAGDLIQHTHGCR
jgi:hypothetical protein